MQIGSALGSALGQWVRLPESRLRLLVACGTAAGIAATFNAPVAGVFFALELVLRDFAVESFAAVVLSSVTASVIGRAAFGDHPFLSLPSFHIASPVAYLFFVVLGGLAALLGVGFSRTLYLIEDIADRLWRGPQWLRPAVGGLLLGGVLLVLPQMYGVGYPVLGAATLGTYTFGFLLVLMVGKVFATSLTMGIGGSGGVFAPSLFIGATFGAAFGIAMHAVLPQFAGSPGAYALVGMGAVFAGAARTPLTAVIIMFELTGEYSIILPLMVSIALAAGLSRVLSRDTIYTRKLLRRGIDIENPKGDSRLDRLSVGAAMNPLPVPLGTGESLAAVAARFAGDDHEALPVVDDKDELRGVVLASEVERALRDESARSTAAELARTVPILRSDQSLEVALDALIHHGGGLPVLDSASGDVTGWLTHRDVLRTAAGMPAVRRPPTTPVRVAPGRSPVRHLAATRVNGVGPLLHRHPTDDR